MAWNEKLARQMAKNRQNGPQMDKFDLEAEREGRSCSFIRQTCPSVMGKRIEGAKMSFRKTSVGSSHNINLLREKKLGFGA